MILCVAPPESTLVRAAADPDVSLDTEPAGSRRFRAFHCVSVHSHDASVTAAGPSMSLGGSTMSLRSSLLISSMIFAYPLVIDSRPGDGMMSGVS